MLWFGAIILTGVLFIPEGVFDGVAGLADIPAAAGHVPLDAVIALALIAAFNVVDVYITVKRSNASIEGVRCVHCGKVVDEELSFCHWCTTEFSGEHA